MDRVAIIPAAGQASRLPPLPCSKELFPIGFQSAAEGIPQPRPVCLYLLESLRRAGVHQAYIAIAPNKWDVPEYLGDGEGLGLSLAYLVVRNSRGPADTVARAAPFVSDSVVLLGFPDIIFEPVDAFLALLERQEATEADAVLGLFPTDQPQKVDMVEVAPDGRVRRVEIKPERTALDLTWLIAVWTPRFSAVLRERAQSMSPGGVAREQEQELHIGSVLNVALERGMHVDSVTFDGPGGYRDIGTPDDLFAAVKDMGL